MTDQGEWKLVSRRRRYPENWREKSAQPQQQHPATLPFVPFSHTYAQAIAIPIPDPNRPKLSTRPTSSTTMPPTTTPPFSPTLRPPSKTYISPHSPIALRFPPSPFFVEWRGRCFRCCRTGHAAASCKFPAKCGKCWADGHIGSRCNKEKPKQVLNPAAKPFKPVTDEVTNMEPSFDSMLTGTFPYVPPVLPKARSLMHTCFVERDAEYYAELERLSSAIVVTAADGIDVRKIAESIAESGMVRAEDLSFATMTRGRHLVLLPNRLAPNPVIRAIPANAWEMGLDFQQWSPLDNAAINIPNFKIILNILDVPPHLSHERQMIRATCGIGLYLGTVDQVKASNIEAWTAVIATDNLERIPPAVTIIEGGMQHTMPIKVIKVSPGPIYSPKDLPVMPMKYKKPMHIFNIDSTSEEDEDDLFTCSTRVLQDLCKGRDQDTILPEIKDMLAGIKRPRLSKEDLITFLLHHEPEKSASDNLASISEEQSAPHQSLVVKDPVVLSVQTLTQENRGFHDLPHIHKPHGIREVGESSGSILEGVPHALQTDNLRGLRRQNVRSHALTDVKSIKGKTRALIKSNANRTQKKKLKDLKPVPMKKVVKRMDPKTPYGQLHQRPHGKGLLHSSQVANPRQIKSKANQEVPFAPLSRDYLLRNDGAISNFETTRQQGHANGKRNEDFFENGPGPDGLIGDNNQGPTNGIDLHLNPGGFYSVHVNYDKCTALANGCGMNEFDVDETVIEENDYLKQAPFSASIQDDNQQDHGERVCTDPITSDDEETETD